MQRKRIVAAGSIVLIVNFFIILIRWSDSPLDFIPFLDIFIERRLRIYAYDIFLAVTVLLYLLLYKKYGINLSVIKSIPFLFYPISRLDAGISIGAAIISYTFICPFIFQFLSDPILKISKFSHDSVRHTIMMALIFSLVFIVAVLSKNSSTGSYCQSPPSHTNTMPPPPTWP